MEWDCTVHTTEVWDAIDQALSAFFSLSRLELQIQDQEMFLQIPIPTQYRCVESIVHALLPLTTTRDAVTVKITPGCRNRSCEIHRQM